MVRLAFGAAFLRAVRFVFLRSALSVMLFVFATLTSFASVCSALPLKSRATSYRNRRSNLTKRHRSAWQRLSLTSGPVALISPLGRSACAATTFLFGFIISETINHEIAIRKLGAHFQLTTERTDILAQRAQKKI